VSPRPQKATKRRRSANCTAFRTELRVLSSEDWVWRQGGKTVSHLKKSENKQKTLERVGEYSHHTWCMKRKRKGSFLGRSDPTTPPGTKCSSGEKEPGGEKIAGQHPEGGKCT